MQALRHRRVHLPGEGQVSRPLHQLAHGEDELRGLLGVAGVGHAAVGGDLVDDPAVAVRLRRLTAEQAEHRLGEVDIARRGEGLEGVGLGAEPPGILHEAAADAASDPGHVPHHPLSVDPHPVVDLLQPPVGDADSRPVEQRRIALALLLQEALVISREPAQLSKASCSLASDPASTKVSVESRRRDREPVREAAVTPCPFVANESGWASGSRTRGRRGAPHGEPRVAAVTGEEDALFPPPGDGVGRVADAEVIRVPYREEIGLDREVEASAVWRERRRCEGVSDHHALPSVRTELEPVDLEAVEHRAVAEPIPVRVVDELGGAVERRFWRVADS